MDKKTERRLRPFVAGFEGMPADTRGELIKLSKMPAGRQGVYFAAMEGRDWMYHAEYGAGYDALRDCITPGEYWRSVREAIEIAETARDFDEEKRWFLAPIPNSKPESASPITLAEAMEPA